MKFDAPELRCPRCDVLFHGLFCLRCACTILDEFGLLANAGQIIHMSTRKMRSCPSKRPCILCSKDIFVDEKSRFFSKDAYAHLYCVKLIRERLDAVMPKRPVAQQEGFELSGSIELS